MKVKFGKRRKLNNQGFVATAVLYSLIGILGVILFMTISNLSTTRKANTSTSDDIKSELSKYSVVYNSNGGIGTMSDSIFSSGKTHTLKANTYAKTGYGFIGWDINASSETATYADKALINNQGSKDAGVKTLPVLTGKAIDLYAIWNPKTYKITFDSNTGTVSLTSKDVVYDSIYGILPTPSKANYNFLGWYTAKTGGSIITENMKVAIAGNQTLYAKWEPKTFTVTFHPNGGAVSPTTQTVTYDATYGLLPTPTRTGYEFVGWYTSTSGGTQITESTKVAISADQTLYARWKAKKFTVTFDANGGTVSPNSKEVTYDATYETLPTPTKGGYDFVGWYTEKTGGTLVATSSKVTITTNQTLYARWENKKLNITFDPNQGTVSPTSKEVIYDATYGDLPTPNRTGYSFTGWYTAKSGGSKIEAATKVTITENQTLYARWEAKKFTVAFDANGGTATPTSKEVTYNSTYGSLASATRIGYTFTGWYTAKSGGTKIESATKVGITNNQTLYARWSANTNTAYVVKHWTQNIGAASTQNSSNYSLYQTENLTGTTDASITPGVKSITGFTAPSEQTTTILGDGSRVVNYYYTRNSYTLTLNKGTGISSVSGSGTYKYGESITINATVSSGYTWSKWSGTHSTTTKQYTFTMPASNVTDTANATANNYTVTFDANGGTATPKNKEVTYNSTYGSLATATRSGYDFVGWYTAKSGGTKIEAATKVEITNNQTLYARWEAKSYDATKNESTYAATLSCSNGRVLSGGNCIHTEEIELGDCGYYCSSGCGLCHPCEDRDGTCGCEDDGGSWVSHGSPCYETITEIQNEYRVYACNSGDSLSSTTCTHITYTCPNGGTLNGTTCVFE